MDINCLELDKAKITLVSLVMSGKLTDQANEDLEYILGVIDYITDQHVLYKEDDLQISFTGLSVYDIEAEVKNKEVFK
jgi:hypothetical protein